MPLWHFSEATYGLERGAEEKALPEYGFRTKEPVRLVAPIPVTLEEVPESNHVSTRPNE